MAELNPKPYPPGNYPVIIVGSGPGGLQTSYCLTRLGVEHAVISEDPGPGGMFRHFPYFDRLISWTKPFAPVKPGTREYVRYDWNSLIGDTAAHNALVRPYMDNVSYFPSRPAMQKGLTDFAQKGKVKVRYGCNWEGTRKTKEGFKLITSDGEYSAKLLIIAVGVTKPWVPSHIPGIKLATHYANLQTPSKYSGKRVFIIGKRNSGFEVANGLLTRASQLILASPSPLKVSLDVAHPSSARVVYLQPYEDSVLGGGHLVLDATISKITRVRNGFRVATSGTTRPGDLIFDVDEVIATTGFDAPLRDLAKIGVSLFGQGPSLPAQTNFWESSTVPGIYFAGSITQGSAGLNKYGRQSSSGVVHGFRHNARVLARHIAMTHFGYQPSRRLVSPADVTGFLLSEATWAPEIWNQKSYLARVLQFEDTGEVVDKWFHPLAHFVDSTGPPAAAITIETDATGVIRPALYVRRLGNVEEHILDPNLLLDFETDDYQSKMKSLLKGLV